jgi:hypothetical protein
METWTVAASPVWHLATTGIPVIEHRDAGNQWRPLWRPWPGESVELVVTRPAGAPGRSLTLDNASLEIEPGPRSTNATLSMRLRSSRGGEHALSLPDGAELMTVVMDGAVKEHVKAEGTKVTLPIDPGEHSVSLAWRDAGVLRSGLFRTPRVDVGLPGVNAEVVLRPPAERWLLFVGGQGAGPAVLFWSQIVAVALAAFLLARLPLTPLKAWQWFLLGVGLAQATLAAAIVVTLFLLAVGLRRTYAPAVKGKTAFNAVQVVLAGWAVAAAGCVIGTLEAGFFGTPDMQIEGNGSSAARLVWFRDRIDGVLPEAWMISVPLVVYQVAMLAWALWFAFTMVGWARWLFACYTEGGMWRPFSLKQPPVGNEPPKF